MILSIHLLAGAAIASKIQPSPLALTIAFLSHFLLDFLPHSDYSINKIKEKKWGESFPVFLKIVADILVGLLAIFLLSKNTPLIYAGAFGGVLTDCFLFLGIIFPNKMLKGYNALHRKIHFSENPPAKKIVTLGIILTQALIISLSLVFLR